MSVAKIRREIIVCVVSNVERYIVFLENDHAVNYTESKRFKVLAVFKRCGHFLTRLSLVTSSDHNFKWSNFFSVTFLSLNRFSLPDNVYELSSFVKFDILHLSLCLAPIIFFITVCFITLDISQRAVSCKMVQDSTVKTQLLVILVVF